MKRQISEIRRKKRGRERKREMCTFVDLCTKIHMYEYTYIYTCMNIHMYIYISKDMCMYEYTYVHIYISKYICMHMNIHK